MSIISNARDLSLQATAPRLTVTAVTLTPSSSSFIKYKNVAAIAPSFIDITTITVGFTTPNYSWYYKPSTSSTFTLITGATSSTYSPTSSTFLAQMSTGLSVEYKCVVTQTGWSNAESSTVIQYNRQNNDIPVATLNKPSILLPTSSADVVTYTDTDSKINVSIGGTNIPYAASGANTFSVTAAVTSGTVIIGTPTTTTTTVTNDTRSFGILSGMAAGNAAATITYTVIARDVDGVATTISLTQTIAKAPSGSNGVNPVSISYTNKSLTVPTASDGAVLSTSWIGSGGILQIYEGVTPLTLLSNTQSISYPGTTGYNLSIIDISGNTLTEPTISGSTTTTATIGPWAGTSLTTTTVYRINAYVKTSLGTNTLISVDVVISPGTAGLDSTIYYIDTSAPVITKQAPDAATSGVHSSINIQGKQVIGDTVSNYGWITVTANGDVEAGTATNTATTPITLSPINTAGKTSYTIKMYNQATVSVPALLDTEVINVVFNGNSGYTVNITGGTRSIVYDNAGSTTATTSQLTASVQQNGVAVAATYSWTATGVYSGTSSVATFTPVLSAHTSTTSTITVVVTPTGGAAITTVIPIAVSRTGATGANGSRTATITEYLWATSPPSLAADTTSRTYTWSSGAISGYTSTWAAAAPSENRSGYYLYEAAVVVTDSTGIAATSNFTWSTATIRAIAYNGRGAGWFKSTEVASQATLDGYSSATLTTKFIAATGIVTPVKDDVFTIVGTSPAIRVVTYDGATWSTPAQFINGNLVVDGTVRSRAIVTENLSAISADLGEVRAAKITTADTSQTFQVGAGSGNLLNILSKSNSATDSPLTSIYNYTLNSEPVVYIEDNGAGKVSANASGWEPSYRANFSNYTDTDRGGYGVISRASTKVPMLYVKGNHENAQVHVTAYGHPPNLSNIRGYVQNGTTEFVEEGTPSNTGSYIFLNYTGSYSVENGFLYRYTHRDFYTSHKITDADNSLYPVITKTTGAKIIAISANSDSIYNNYSVSGNNIYLKNKYSGTEVVGSTLKPNQRIIFKAGNNGGILTATSSVVTGPSNNLVAASTMVEFTVISGTSGLVENKTYYMVSPITGTTSYSLSLTPSGAAINTTGLTGGVFSYIKQLYITNIIAEERSQYCTITSGSTTITVENGALLQINQYVDSSDATKGIPANTQITAINGNVITLNVAPTKTQSTLLTFNYAITLNSAPPTLIGNNFTYATVNFLPYIICNTQANTTGIEDNFNIRHSNTTAAGDTASDAHGMRLQTYVNLTPTGSEQYTKVNNYVDNYQNVDYENTDTTTLASSVLLATQYNHAMLVDRGSIASREIYPTANASFNLGLPAPPLIGGVTINTTDPGSYNIVYTYAVSSPSDVRFKTNIQQSILGLDFINKLNPVSYKWIVGRNIVGDNDDVLGVRDITSVPGVRTHFGLIAQEVKQALPADLDFAGWALADKTDSESTQSLQYLQLISPMIKAIQELSTKISVLEQEIAALNKSTT